MSPRSAVRSALVAGLTLALVASSDLVTRAAPLATVQLSSASPDLDVAVDETLDRADLVESGTVSLRISSRAAVVREASMEVTLPEGALISRLALKVDERWMEAEVLPRAAARRFYQAIVHPTRGPRRDPALMVELAAGRWSLDVFPIPAGGQRELELVWHRLRAPADARAAQRLERRAIPAGGSETVFALAPAREAGLGRAGRDAGPLTRVVIAVDTSLSIGERGLTRARELVARLVRALPVEVRIVTGDLTTSACTSTLEVCLSGPVGGASDLGALLTVAVDEAGTGSGRAAIVLLSDGLVTLGRSAPELSAAVASWTASHPIALFTVPLDDDAVRRGLATEGRTLLAALAETGLGASIDLRSASDEATLVAAIRAPRRARVSAQALAGEVDALAVTWVGERPMVLGTSRSAKVELELTWSDDKGRSRSRFTFARESGPARYGLFQQLGRALVHEHERLLDASAVDLARLSREHGVAGPYGSLLALETVADYQSRGIGRPKAFELMASRGDPTWFVAPQSLSNEEGLRVDGDGDGIPDAQDQCPAEPETVNGTADDDGCPDTARVIIERSELRILDRVYFAAGKRTILPASEPLIAEVAAVMRDNPWLEVVELGGHTDPREPRAMALSLGRAEAVRAALVRRGVDAQRLVVNGYGAERPIAPNDTADGRARNRRVEFTILVAHDQFLAVGATPQSIESLVQRMGLTPTTAHQRQASLLLIAGLRDAAASHLAAALTLAPTAEARLAIFDATLAAAFPDPYAEVALASLAAGGRGAVVAPLVFWSTVLARLGEADRPAVTPAMIAYLATRTPEARRLATRADVLTEAGLLRFLGDLSESRRRASELIELGLEPPANAP